MNHFTEIPITLSLAEKILGGIPKHPALLDSWLASRAKPPVNGEPLSQEAWTEERAAEMRDLIEPTEDKSWCSFLRDADGIFLTQIQILAFLRDMASTLGYLKTVRGLRQTLQHTMAIEPARVRLTRHDQIIANPDGFDEHAVHVMTPQGPRTSIVRSDYVEAPAEIRFNLLVATKREPKLTEEQVRELFEIGGRTNGLGARRSQGFGRFAALVGAESLPAGATL